MGGGSYFGSFGVSRIACSRLPRLDQRSVLVLLTATDAPK